jgi:serine-type D-Ala-D-Ala carboxypeptidase/endopeptidase (penicillin-binding protein 4)
MQASAAAENVRAKTGTLAYVNTLSGYVTSKSGAALAFSIMLNNYNPVPPASGRSAVDAIAVLLAEFNGQTN